MPGQTLRVPGVWDSQMKGVRLSAQNAFTPSKYSCYTFLLEAESNTVRPEGICQMKNFNDTVGNRTRDLPNCSAVPQPTTPLRLVELYTGKSYHKSIENVAKFKYLKYLITDNNSQFKWVTKESSAVEILRMPANIQSRIKRAGHVACMGNRNT